MNAVDFWNFKKIIIGIFINFFCYFPYLLSVQSTPDCLLIVDVYIRYLLLCNKGP